MRTQSMLVTCLFVLHIASSDVCAQELATGIEIAARHFAPIKSGTTAVATAQPGERFVVEKVDMGKWVLVTAHNGQRGYLNIADVTTKLDAPQKGEPVQSFDPVRLFARGDGCDFEAVIDPVISRSQLGQYHVLRIDARNSAVTPLTLSRSNDAIHIRFPGGQTTRGIIDLKAIDMRYWGSLGASLQQALRYPSIVPERRGKEGHAVIFVLVPRNAFRGSPATIELSTKHHGVFRLTALEEYRQPEYDEI